MVMEAATLSGPQRKCNVVPVQKSLSLPSYARVGGEGIDHRLIFAALEQKEKVRRKSKIFTREKTARQNIFCLPISTGSKCKETSFSSDTSCSSLEYQKPKSVPKLKKEDSRQETKLNENDRLPNEHKTTKTNTFESKSTLECMLKETLTQNGVNGHSEQSHYLFKGSRSPVDTFRLNVGSSDSMERSSRSSNDSLTRKERLVAIKARVEAEREKYGNSSSEEESCSNMTRYNSDGVIHRTVREVKSRSYRHDKRLRRRSQGEWASKKSDRKNNLSLCLNPEDDGIKLHLEKLDRLNNEINNLEVKTDYCPSPSFPEITKKSYFSDFPSRENVTKFVQQRIRLIEEEERKRRSGSDFFDKMKSSPRMSPLLQEKLTYASTEQINKSEKKSESSNYNSDILSSNTEFMRRASPIPRINQAPTPPPRSPKSITFVNKAFLQHQNATLLHQENTLDKKNFFQPNATPITPTRQSDKFYPKVEVITRDSKSPFKLQGNPDEKQQMRELFNSRRKTCGNFDFVDEKSLNDLCSSLGTAGSSNLATNNSSQSSSSLTHIKSIDKKDCASGIEASSLSVIDTKNKWGVNKWEESERRREFMFNSLENKKKCNMLPWVKKKVPSVNTDTCICYLTQGNKTLCECRNSETLYKSKSIENNGVHLSNFDGHKEKVLFSEPVRKRWETPNENPDTCVCYLKVRNQKICECKSSKIKDKSENFNIRAIEQRNSPKLSRNNKLNGEKEMVHKRVTPSQVNTSVQHSSTQNFNCLSDKTAPFDLKFSNDDIMYPITDTSATANLESAMAELESVYLSLKFSSDNLSDRNSLSNISLSDEDSKVFTKNNKDPPVNKDLNFKRSSVHETNSYFDILDASNTNKNSDRLKSSNDYPNHLNTSTVNNISTPTKDVTAKDLAINELFKGLTPRLGALNQNIDTCGNRQPLNVPEIKSTNNKLSSNPSPIGFKKEFYENLQKQQQQGNNLQRKKLKAVRSLSENISQLMNFPNNNNKTVCRNLSENNFQPATSLPPSANNSPSDSYKSLALDSWKIESKHELASDSSRQINRTSQLDKSRNHKQEEIRHIRVSMDSTFQPTPAPVITYPETSHYSRLSSAVYSPQMSPKCEVSKPFQFNPSSNSKETIDKTIDGLEELLNSLLVDVPESNQTSLSKKKDPAAASSPSPISTGHRENVKAKRYFFPSKMDMCVTSKSKNEVSSAECRLRNVKSEEKAQKENADFRQNNNTHLSQMSFIPVYTKKSDMCHYFSDKGDENKSKPADHRDQIKLVRTSNSPPTRQKCLVDQNEKLSLRSVRTHTRRRSVGFEDMTSLNSCYLGNEKSRTEALTMNSNITTGSDMACNKMLNSDNDFHSAYGRRNLREASCISTLNQNSKVVKNANDHVQETSRPQQQYKDKSSKRKSSLNRMDFIDFPTTYTGNLQSKQSYRSKNSSSDEEIDTKVKQQNSEFLTNSIKRKHNISPGSTSAISKSLQKTPNEALYQCTSSINKQKSLPKSSQTSHFKLRHHRRAHSIAKQLQKLSHSAGELESLTDETNTVNKVCLSAQEFDTRDPSTIGACSRAVSGSNFKKYSSQLPPVNRSSSPMRNSNQDTSQHKIADIQLDEFRNSSSAAENNVNIQVSVPLSKTDNSCEKLLAMEQEHVISNAEAMDEPVLSCFNLIDSFELKHIDSKSEDDSEVVESTQKLQRLDISEEKNFESAALASDDNCDSAGSDSGSRPNSILRKKFFEERKELHGILKPPPDDKLSKAPHSILKHRESSEEKETWQQSDLHSILKKSTSEDESCNSGPDIRPILKVSTDEESPGGSAKPRPILKKRTSFSEECSYACYPNNELKPILKKKTQLSNDDQPRPILKGRRKSEDTRSTLSDFVASRPRAYSADMGVKPNHESMHNGLEQKTDDFCNRENQQL